jgi:hypothetical protein
VVTSYLLLPKLVQVPDDEELADFVAQLEAHQGHHHRGHHKRSSAGGSSGGADQGSDREGGELSPVREGASTSAAAAAATSTEAAGGGGTDARGEGAEEEEGGPREGMSSLHDGAGGAPGKAPRASSMRAVLKSPTSLYVDPDYIQDSEDRVGGWELSGALTNSCVACSCICMLAPAAWPINYLMAPPVSMRLLMPPELAPYICARSMTGSLCMCDSSHNQRWDMQCVVSLCDACSMMVRKL